MARRQTTREAKKLKDKWKAKQWYTIVAPDMFNRAQIGETLSDDPSKLIGRHVEVTLQDLTGDFRMMHVKLRFRIVDHSTTEAYTRFVGHDLTSDYIRRQTRRKRTKMEGVYDVVTKDGYTIRIKPMAISDKRIQSSVQYDIRKIMGKAIAESASKHNFSELLSLVLTTDRDKSLVSTIHSECKKIYPLRRVDIRKVEVISYPEISEDQKGVSSEPVPEETGEDVEPTEETGPTGSQETGSDEPKSD